MAGDRVAILTGGSGGIGKVIAKRLRADGHRVANLDIIPSPLPLEGVTDVHCDLADPASVAAGVDRVRSELGPVSVVVHCAAYQVLGGFEEIEAETWDRTFQVNVRGAFDLLRATLPDMRAAGWGRIVVVTSSTQFTPPPAMTHYVASKGALTGMVRALATEIGPAGITINAVAPGLTGTDHALRDLPEGLFEEARSRQAIPHTGTPEDIAAVVAFAVSDDSRFMTGQTLLVDGGTGRI